MAEITLTKENSQAIKGIAILLMLAHHLFYSAKSFKGMPVEFFVLDINTVFSLARFAKLCVPLFVFVTAYGLSAKFNSVKWNRRTIEKITSKRLVSLLLPFWFIFIIAQIICNVSGKRTYIEVYGEGNCSLFYCVLDALGLSHCMDTPTLNATWWYMSLALLLIFILPLLWRLTHHFGPIVFFGAFVLFRSAGWSNTGYFNYVLVGLLGIAVYETAIIEKVASWLTGRLVAKIAVLIVSILVLGGCFYLNKQGGYQDIVFCLGTIVIVYIQCEYLSRVKLLTRVFTFFGKHSMNIFLLHTFIKTYLLHDFIYSFKYGILIWSVLIITSLAASIIVNGLKILAKVNKLQNCILNKIEET